MGWNSTAYGNWTPTLTTATWYLFEVKWDGANLILKVNNVQSGTAAAVTTTFASNVNAVSMGSFGQSVGNGDLGRYFNGDIAACLVYNIGQSSTDETATKNVLSTAYNLGL